MRELVASGTRNERQRLVIHVINTLSNWLADDSLSRVLRRTLLSWMGVRLGARSVLDGGGYVCGRQLVMGRQCYVNRGCYFDLVSTVTFGDGVIVGQRVMFITAAHRLGPSTRRAGPVEGRPITVGDGVWIGAHATILPGVTIGAGSVVAAGALVVHDVPPNTLSGGVPARVIRSLGDTAMGQP